MYFLVFIKGLLVGVALSAPTGPVAVYCIRNGIAHGFKSAAVVGVAATLADTIFTAMAAFGLTSLTSVLIHYHDWVRAIAGLVLLIMGVKLLLARHSRERREPPDSTRSFMTAFGLSITNPLTIVSIVLILAALGLGSLHQHDGEALTVTIGVFCGALCWWMGLSMLAAYLKSCVTNMLFLWINRTSGVLLLIFAMIAWLSIGHFAFFHA